MKEFYVYILMVGSLLVSSCGLHRPFIGPVLNEEADNFLSLTEFAEHQPDNMSTLPAWREFITDTLLQQLIDTALVRNNDLALAEIRIRQAEINEVQSRRTFLPTLGFSPSVNAHKSKGESDVSSSLSFNLGWNPGTPGSIFASRNQALAQRLKAEDQANQKRSFIINYVACYYFSLVAVEMHIRFLNSVIPDWEQSLKTQRALMENGKVYYTSIAQLENILLKARYDLVTCKSELADYQRIICLFLAEPYHDIEHKSEFDYKIPHFMYQGVSLDMLRRRSDVRAAERDLEVAYYLTTEAKSALFPSLHLTASVSWPQQMMQLSASLLQPIFAQGALRARVKTSELEQEAARLTFSNTLLNAGSELHKSLTDFQFSQEKLELSQRQAEILDKAYKSLTELSKSGKANYLELTKIQDKYLDSYVDVHKNTYYIIQAILDTYMNLGGF